ncbi:MAG TPA: DUF3631 domain-containing protein [Kineosporiaceae bacterium]|nr:DUF3631 domain-containing protein [Kineosporiaceae bacterium]
MSGTRPTRDSPTNPTQGEPLPTTPSQPTDAPPIDGATLLDQVREAVRRYVILPTEHDLNAITVWIAASHGQQFWAAAPRLVIRAPEKRCGKSRLLDLVESMCHNPLITVNASPAAIYRSIGVGDPPTLLIDEADTIFGPKAGDANEELRGLLNAGHQRNRAALRYNAASNDVEKIPTFAMAALAGIGAMPDTIEDRAVVVRMRRRAPGEEVAAYRHRRDAPALAALRTRLRVWIRANGKALEAATPVMPLEDRAADTWEPLFAVADLAGGEWPARIHAAALALTAAKEASTDQPLSVRLLEDCRTAFADIPALRTDDLLDRLKEDPEAPWATWAGRTDGLTAMKLGALLKDFDIRSARWTEDGKTVRGYERADFLDAWQRYCTPPKVTEGDDTGSGVPLPPPLPDHDSGGKPSKPSEPSNPRSGPRRLETLDGSSRRAEKAVHGLTCEPTASTASTARPPKPAVCIVCREPLTYDDGTHAHPLCIPA